MNICIIGNNLTSLILSKMLASKKINVTIFSHLKNKPLKTNRSIGITPDNVDFIKNNLFKPNKRSFHCVNKIEVYSEQKNKILDFYDKGKELLYLIKIENFVRLLNKIKEPVKIEKKKINKNKIINKLNKHNFDLVINCEKNNQIANSFFYKSFKKDYLSDAYTFIISHQKIKNKKAFQIFTKYGPLAFLPLSSNETSIVFSVYRNKNFEIKNILKFLKKNNSTYLIKKISKIEKIGLKFSAIRNYHKGKILQFGDSLHQIHPLAGQGFNMTLRDLKVLVHLIEKRINLGLPLDASILKDFESKTKHYNFIYSNGINFIQSFFQFNNKYINSFYINFISQIGKNKKINKFILEAADKGINLK